MTILEGVPFAVPFQPASPVRVNDRYSLIVCNGDMVWLYSNELAVLLMGSVYGRETSSTPALIE